MADIADRAGVTRRTVYRAFPTRKALVEAVAVARLDAIILQVRPQLDMAASLADALVTGFVAFIRLARADAVLIAALDEASDWHLERVLVGPDDKFFSRAQSLWGDAIDRAIATGEWRSGLDAAEVNAWFRAVAVILLLRDDLDTAGQERLIRTFVVPALVAGRPALVPS